MKKKLIIVTTILLGAILLSACAGGPTHGSTWPGLATDGSLIYLADGPFIYAVSLGDGREIWRYPGERNSKLVFYAPPTVTPDGLVIVGSAGTDHSLIALSPNDINPDTNAPFEQWRFTGARDYWVAAPLIVENRLFAVNSDGNLYIIDLQDGRSSKEATVVELGGRLWSQPTTDGERVYITSLDHSVIAVDANTYEVVWHENLAGAVPGSAVPTEDGSLYVGSLASQLEKFDPATGNHQAVVDAENWVWSTPRLDGDTLYFGDVDGNFYSYNTSTGSQNWNPIKPDNSTTLASITASPLVREEHILVATESGSVFAVDRDGKVLWNEAIGGKIYTSPIAAGDLTIVAPLETDFYLAALDSNGRQVWTFTPEN
ncbi:MAG TPA: PQQ-binding-like beta-propeller repeat protein [Anaerolineales bacterium]|nr:PQQ-binding-like beta-propeller repeat protein [Anaerolineales bacterium]